MTSDQYYRLTSRTNRVKIVRRGCRNTSALVSYDTIPLEFQEKIYQRIGDPRKKVATIRFRDYLQHDPEAHDYYRNVYRKPDGTMLAETKIQEYAANAAALNAIDHLIVNKFTTTRGAGKAKKTNIWQKFADIIKQLPSEEWPCSLPAKAKPLQRKYSKYKKEHYAALVHGGQCNINGEKINDLAKEWLIARWADQINICADTEQLWNEYNERAKEEGWKPLIDDRAIYNYLHLEEIKSVWITHRYGSLKAKEHLTYHHSTRMPTMRDSLWYSDGTKLNFHYLDQNGKMATCQVYEVMDAYSEVFLGYHVSPTEDYVAQYHAYKMAAKTAGHRPYQITMDNQGGHKKLESGEFLSKLARLAINTEPYNGKSKTIESAFGRFQTKYMKRLWFFTGQNVKAKRDESQPRIEFILANKDKLPTLAEAIEAYVACRRLWNEAPHHRTKVPKLEMYLSSTNPKAPELSLWDMVDFFWIKREKTTTYSPGGLSFIEKKVEYEYVVYDRNRKIDMKFHVDNINKKFHVKFDPEDMSLVYLYENTPLGLRFVTAAETKPTIARNRQEINQAEDQYYKQMKKANDTIRIEKRDEVEEILKKHGARAEDYGFNLPPVKGIENRRKTAKAKTKTKAKTKKGYVGISDIAGYEKKLSNAVQATDDDIYDIM